MCTHFSMGTSGNRSSITYTENWDGEHSSAGLPSICCGSPPQLDDPPAPWPLGEGAAPGCPPSPQLYLWGVVRLTWVVTR